MTIDTPLQFLKGVGPKVSQKLSRLGLNSVRDFIYFFPRTYEDRRKMINGRDFVNFIDQEIMTVGTVVSIKESGHKMSVLKATMLTTDKKSFQAIWFNQKFMNRYLQNEKIFFLKGKLTFDSYHRVFQLQVTDYEVVQKPQDLQRVMPVYQLTAGVYQKTLRNIAFQIFEQININLSWQI